MSTPVVCLQNVHVCVCVCVCETTCVIPDVGVRLQTQQGVLSIVEDALLDPQLRPGLAADGGLPGGPVLHGKTGSDVTDGRRLDDPCNVKQQTRSFVHTDTF